MLAARDAGYHVGDVQILDRCTLTVTPGVFTAIVGPNGAGKSTLLALLSGELVPTSGEVVLDETPLNRVESAVLARTRAVLPQHSNLTSDFTGLEVVLMGRTPHVRGWEGPEDLEIARRAMRVSESVDHESRLYPTLSGGEQQRIHLARAFAQVWEEADRPRYLLLDEPIASLDIHHQHTILNAAKEFAQAGAGVVAVVHDLNLAAQYADHVVMMAGGRITAQGTPAPVFTEQAIEAGFRTRVIVTDHPCHNCPLIVSVGASRSVYENVG